MNLIFDIESIGSSDPAVREQIAATIKAPGTMKKAETIALWEANDKPAAVDEAVLKTSFDGAYGQVVCIGWAWEDEPVKSHCMTDEGCLLRLFYADVIARMKQHRELTVIGHNISGFDLRFLWKRSVVNGIRPPSAIPFKAKPWDASLFDTMVQWDAATDKRISLDNLCRVLGVPSSKGDMDGSKVWETYRAGDLDKIAKYCGQDVEATRAVYRRMIFAPVELQAAA